MMVYPEEPSIWAIPRIPALYDDDGDYGGKQFPSIQQTSESKRIEVEETRTDQISISLMNLNGKFVVASNRVVIELII